MAIEDQGIKRPKSPDDQFLFQPYYREDFIEAGVADPTKGTDIMDGLLLDQYKDKPNLRAYMLAYIEEMDKLFFELDNVYLGRFVEQAVGIQLDHIGVIINQNRQVLLPGVWFGFDGALDVDKMADQASPADGGVFRDALLEGFTAVPLSDEVYRRTLLAKAQLHNRHNISVNQLYTATSTILGRTPRRMELQSTGLRQLDLVLSREDTTSVEQALIQYLSQYHTPLGTTLVVSRVV